LGWRGIEIPVEDIEWVIAELKDFDLDDESPWLRGYLKDRDEVTLIDTEQNQAPPVIPKPVQKPVIRKLQNHVLIGIQ
jgi:hypothetical protein